MIFLSTIRSALRALLVATPFLFVFCLPWVDLGIWRQTETATVVLHMVSALTALLLAALVAGGSRRARAALVHPVFLAFVAVAGLTFFQALVNPLDGFDAPRTLHGLVKHGVGGLWHLDVAILICGYMATASRRWRTAYAVSSLAALAVSALLTWLFINHGENPWVPYDFTGWLGVFAVLAVASGMADRPSVRLSSIIIGLLTLVVARNATAYAAAAVAFLGNGFWKAFPFKRETIRRGSLAFSALVLIGGAFILPLTPRPLESLAIGSIDPVEMRNDGIPSIAPIDHVSVDLKSYGTVWSRGWMARTVLSNLVAHPAALVFGRGWGSFPQVYAEEMRSVPGRVFTQPTETSSKTFYDPHRKADFHSHNLMIETLLSLGIPGALLMVFVFLSPLIFARKRQVPAAAFLVATLCIVGSMWFFVNTMAPILAVAAAAVSRPLSGGDRFRLPVLAGSVAVLIAAGLSLIFFSSILFGVSLAERQARYFEPMDWMIAPPCRAVAGFTAPAREVNVTIFRRFVEAGESSPVPFAWIAQRSKTALNYACILRDLSDHSADPALLDSSLDLRYRLLQASGNFPVIVKMMKVDISYWGDDIRKLLTMAPDRTDVIIPYVNWLILKGDKKEALDAMSKLSPLVMPGDPVADWLDARRAELNGDAPTHRARMAAALRGGIANLIKLRRVDAEVFLDAPPAAPKVETSK